MRELPQVGVKQLKQLVHGAGFAATNRGKQDRQPRVSGHCFHSGAIVAGGIPVRS
jgi:hypothetical protein